MKVLVNCTWAAIAIVIALIFPAPLIAQDMEVSAGKRTISIAAITDGIIRVRIADSPTLPADESWVVPAEIRAARAKAVIDTDRLTTRAMTVRIDPRSLAVEISDSQGRLIVSDGDPPLSRSGTQFTLNKRLAQQERIFAVGDKTGLLDRRGRAFTNWTTDTYGYSSSSDPTYKSIPFYISAGGEGGAYGLLLDNPFRSWFDFGQRSADVLSFGAEGGAIDYYVIAGPTIADVVRNYTALTGKAPLPPRWVLGYQQSRWSYMSEDEVRELAERFHKERIPLDVIWLDIDFQDRNRPFTINAQAFPNFSRMVKDLDGQGIKTVAITDMHIAAVAEPDYRPYAEGISGDHFLKNADGSIYVAPVWPGPSVFPDFTRKATRRWWGELLSGLVNQGVAGIWNDMNEPAIFETPSKTMPLSILHRIEDDGFAPRVTSHRELHNIYGMENSRATYEGLRRLRPDERAFVLTRASFAGGQRYAATWTGDNSSTWDHLRLSVSQTLNLGLSGFAWAGADVGGFTGGPSPDLLTRWSQFATFAPIFRNHSQKDAPRAEPWVHGEEHLAIRRRFIEERYRLIPYIYAVAEHSSRTGDPIMRPLFYDYPDMLETECDMAMQFTLGRDILIAGSPRPESPRGYQACLPAGGWYDYWTGKAVDQRVRLELTPSIETLPVFVRAGTILPRQPLVQSLGQRPQGALELHVYPGNDCAGEIYDDDGHSQGFTRGEFFRQQIHCRIDGGKTGELSFEGRQGSFKPWWDHIRVVIHGSVRYSASLAGQPITVDQQAGQFAFNLPDMSRGGTVTLSQLD